MLKGLRISTNINLRLFILVCSKLQRAILLDHVCKNYSRALLYGTRYIYQTMPRYLTLWLDFGAEVLQKTDTSRFVHSYN